MPLHCGLCKVLSNKYYLCNGALFRFEWSENSNSQRFLVSRVYKTLRALPTNLKFMIQICANLYNAICTDRWSQRHDFEIVPKSWKETPKFLVSEILKISFKIFSPESKRDWNFKSISYGDFYPRAKLAFLLVCSVKPPREGLVGDHKLGAITSSRMHSASSTLHFPHVLEEISLSTRRIDSTTVAGNRFRGFVAFSFSSSQRLEPSSVDSFWSIKRGTGRMLRKIMSPSTRAPTKPRREQSLSLFR